MGLALACNSWSTLMCGVLQAAMAKRASKEKTNRMRIMLNSLACFSKLFWDHGAGGLTGQQSESRNSRQAKIAFGRRWAVMGLFAVGCWLFAVFTRPRYEDGRYSLFAVDLC